jgi:hypothetical protein
MDNDNISSMFSSEWSPPFLIIVIISEKCCDNIRQYI